MDKVAATMAAMTEADCSKLDHILKVCTADNCVYLGITMILPSHVYPGITMIVPSHVYLGITMILPPNRHLKAS